MGKKNSVRTEADIAVTQKERGGRFCKGHKEVAAGKSQKPQEESVSRGRRDPLCETLLTG